ncbi:hypothetical protein DL769_010232 [Monosporascus sp. CRB-8-3]|nr:hypothetical protein DL769_010232 [Monosporascus sp. CRB-8-3]
MRLAVVPWIIRILSAIVVVLFYVCDGPAHRARCLTVALFLHLAADILNLAPTSVHLSYLVLGFAALGPDLIPSIRPRDPAEQLRRDIPLAIRQHLHRYSLDPPPPAFEGEDLLWWFLGRQQPEQDDCESRTQAARGAQREQLRALDFQVTVGDAEAREQLSLTHRAVEVLLESCMDGED